MRVGAPHYRRVLVALICLAAALGLRATGALAPWENAWADLACRLLQHEVHSDIVIVGIDETSLAELKTWPWPRSTHAALLDRLRLARPKRVFLDIDFSSASSPVEDESLARAISQWPSDQLVLPAFVQESADNGELTLTRPLVPLADHATLGSVNFRPAADSLIRDAWTEGSWEGQRLPAVFDILAGHSGSPARVSIDYSIAPSSFQYISYADLLKDRVDLSGIAGKTVMVGAMAVELGDMQPVPVHHSIPGVVLQALAVQTVRSGELMTFGAGQSFAGLALWCLLLGMLLSRTSWRWNVLLSVALAGLVMVVALAARAHQVEIEMVPFLVALAGGFICVALMSLEAEKLLSLEWARLANKRKALVESIASSSADCIFCVARDGGIISANAAAEVLFAAGPDELLGKSVSLLLPDLPLNGAGALTSLKGRITEHAARALDGSSLPIELSISPVNYQNEELYTVIARDLRELKAREAQLEFQATHDALTGLPNRHYFGPAVERELGATQEARPVAVFVMDLTRFKEINDTLGHTCGDVVLREVARRFRDIVASRAVIARMGGDEFTVLCVGEQDAGLADLAGRLAQALIEPIAVEGLALDVGVSIGIARAPADGTTAEELLKNADVAMYSAKRSRDHFAFYDPAQNENSVRKLAMVGELRSALVSGGLELQYQPQVLLQSGRVESVEALLRWTHSRYGAISPAELIPIAEATELLRPLTEWTLTEALRQIRTWEARGLAIRVAVNLSARILHDLALPARLAAMLAQHGVSAERLELEVTESAMMNDAPRALTVVRNIRKLGICVSIDDYGTGFSSLAYLRDLSANTLKLDRSFVTDLERSPDNRLIVESTLALAHSLNLQVVAEGIESQWQADFLRRAGYDFGQGYYYSRALPAAACFDWMCERNERAATSNQRRRGEVLAWEAG